MDERANMTDLKAAMLELKALLVAAIAKPMQFEPPVET